MTLRLVLGNHDRRAIPRGLAEQFLNVLVRFGDPIFTHLLPPSGGIGLLRGRESRRDLALGAVLFLLLVLATMLLTTHVPGPLLFSLRHRL